MRPRPPGTRAALCWLVTLFSASLTLAQFAQYTSPGILAQEVESRRNLIEAGYEGARWNLGKLRLDPRFEIRNLRYEDNVLADFEGEESISDLTVTASAGLAAYWLLGSKVYLTAFAAPEYTWWAELDELSSFRFNSGGGVHGHFNRLLVSLDGRTIEQERPLNAETEIPVDVREDTASASVHVDFYGPLGMAVSATATDVRHDEGIEELVDGFDVSPLDRDIERLRAGLWVELSSRFRLGIGVEDLSTEFLEDPVGRSSSGTDPYIEIGFEGNRLRADFSLVDRQLEFTPQTEPSEEPRRDYEGTTGTLNVWTEFRKIGSLQIFGSRNLVYSAVDQEGFFTEERLGIGFKRRLGSLLELFVYGEIGEETFAPTEAFPERLDELTSFGGRLEFDFGSSTSLQLEASGTSYDSNLPQFDRSVTRIGLRLKSGWSVIPY